MPSTGIVNIDAYLQDLSVAAREAAITRDPKLKREYITLLSKQTERLTQLASELERKPPGIVRLSMAISARA